METYNAPSWLAPYTIEAKSILNFCDLHDGLLADLKQAIEIAKVDFPNREEIDVQTVVDPDDGSSLIAVNVTVRDTVANFMTAYRACVSHWSSVFQAPGREFICLGHRIIKP
jgi:hypothetical protein